MNPYKTFNKIGLVRSLDAALIKSDGATVLHLNVKPELSAFESLKSDYESAVNVRVWTCDKSQFVNLVGVTCYPDSGDVLRVTLDDGTVKDYPTARNAANSRYWDWCYNRPGYRIKFYTRFEGVTYTAPSSTLNEG